LHSKDYREGDSPVKKTLSDLALPLHVADEFLEKCSYNVNLILYIITQTILLLLLTMKTIIRTFLHYNQADSIFTTLRKLPGGLN
jgi:hypothetical protein